MMLNFKARVVLVVLLATLPIVAANAQKNTVSTNLVADVDYSIGPGDILKISVYRAPDLDTVVQVSKDGYIVMGAIGRVAVVNMSPAAVGARIAAQLTTSKIFLDPIVNVIVQEYHSKSVSILGAVTRPGEYPIDREGLRISDMLARAGADFGSGAGSVRILNDSLDLSISEEIITADIVSGVEDRKVRPNDTLFVKPAATFYISGEVLKAGAYPVEQGLTVERAIAVAGGLSPRGSKSKIKITRKVNGKDQVLKVKATTEIGASDLVVVGARIF